MFVGVTFLVRSDSVMAAPIVILIIINTRYGSCSHDALQTVLTVFWLHSIITCSHLSTRLRLSYLFQHIVRKKREISTSLLRHVLCRTSDTVVSGGDSVLCWGQNTRISPTKNREIGGLTVSWICWLSVTVIYRVAQKVSM